MKAEWRIPKVSELDYEKPPPVWVPIIAIFVALIAAVLYVVANWKIGTSRVSDDLVINALFISLLIWGLLCGIYYIPYEDWREKVRLWNWLCGDRFSDWRHWSQWNVAIIDMVVMTPEPEVAERILGLEGSAPVNPGATKALQEGTPSAPQRAGQIFEKLLAPLAKQFNAITVKVHTPILLHTDNDTDLLALKSALDKLGFLYDPKGLKRIDPGSEADLIGGWLKPGEYNRYGQYIARFNAALVIAVQLHDEGVDPTYSEAAVALLLTSPADASELKLKPRARLFRPITADPQSSSDALRSLLAARPTPLEKMRHMWLTKLPKLTRNNVLGALDESDLEIARHDLDKALGKPGPANAWLVQALAAQVAYHGQGAQLVATPDGSRVMLNLIGTQCAVVRDFGEAVFVPILPSISMVLVCLWPLLLMLAPPEEGSATLFLVSFGLVLVAALVLQPLFLALRQRKVADAFSNTLRHNRGD